MIKQCLTFVCSKAFMASLGYAVVILADVSMLAIGLHYGPNATAISIAGVGLVSFFGVIGLVNGSVGNGSLDNGEMRKAITAAFITVYLTVVGLTFVHPYPFGLQDDFTKLVGAIVLFYFGSSSFRDYLAAKAARPADASINTPAAPDSVSSKDSDSSSGGEVQNNKTSLLQNIQIISPNPANATASELSTTESNLAGTAAQ
jgi:hypothetical protein